MPSTTLNSCVPLKDVAEAKGLKSTLSLRLELNKSESKYISREIKVNGGTSYEILFSSLEPEIQEKLDDDEIFSRALVPKRRYSKENEYNTKLTKEMQEIFLKYLLHPNKFSVGKAIVLTKHILEKRKIENIPCTLTFRRFAEHYQKTNYSKWVLMREGEKAFHDKVEQYIVILLIYLKNLYVNFMPYLNILLILKFNRFSC